MGKNPNTFQKRQREFEKKQKAEEKRKRRQAQKNAGPTDAAVMDRTHDEEKTDPVS